MADWRDLRELYFGKDEKMAKFSDYEPKVDSLLLKLASSPYTTVILLVLLVGAVVAFGWLGVSCKR